MFLAVISVIDIPISACIPLAVLFKNKGALANMVQPIRLPLAMLMLPLVRLFFAVCINHLHLTVMMLPDYMLFLVAAQLT